MTENKLNVDIENPTRLFIVVSLLLFVIFIRKFCN